MTLAKQICEEYRRTRVFRSKVYPSRKSPGTSYTTTIYWGGTKQNPNIDCTCPKFTFSRDCWHVQAAWEELSEFTKNDIIHHDEIVAKPWYRRTQS